MHLVWTHENGGFRKRLRHLRRFVKTEVLHPTVGVQKRRFSKTITSRALKNNQFGWISGIMVV